MNPEKLPVERIAYPKHLFYFGTGACAVATCVSLYLAHASGEDFGRWFWVGVALSVAAFMALFLLPCLPTDHVAGRDALRLRMGLLIDAEVPYSAMREVRKGRVRRGALSIGVGVRYQPAAGVAYVLSSFSDVVTIDLDEELGLGRAGRPRVHRIVVSVDDGDEAVRILGRRADVEVG